MEALRLYVSVPVGGFRVAQAREYWETYPIPPPATVYGMLLSLVGEENRLAHPGAELAVALLSDPQRSVVLRTLWRLKDKKSAPGIGSNKRPDFQELLSDVRLSVWVRPGTDVRSPSLCDRLNVALDRPADVRRFGGLSLGESTHLVNEVRLWRDSDPAEGRMLEQHDDGDLSLPVWPDHVGSIGTRWAQYRLTERGPLPDPLPESAWTRVVPPEAADAR
jgi:CRISPR-associated protein Cas5t